jgi:beta-fructofuranosidase
VSDDLTTWHRHGVDPLVETDPTWYELLDLAAWYEQAWRDPWVFANPTGDGWHMLITARSGDGHPAGRGVIGHATSPDLLHWTVQPPLSTPAGLGHLEVPQVAVVDGQPLLLFSTNTGTAGHRVWVVPAATVTGPWDVTAAQPFAHPHLYSPRLVPDDHGGWRIIGFLDTVDDAFVGELTDPVPVRYDPTVGLLSAEPTPVSDPLPAL